MDEGPSIVSYVLGVAFCAVLIDWQMLRGKIKKTAANSEPRAPTLEDLQGQWRIVSFGQNGGKAPFFVARRMKARLVVEEGRFTKFMGGRPFETGIGIAMGWTRMPRKRPIEIVNLSLGPGQPRRSPSIVFANTTNGTIPVLCNCDVR